VQLKEHLTQIVTIVSSIVAISKDNLPSATKKEGEAILADLTENCDKLGEMQGLMTFDKPTKTNMASASYGVAKGLKALESLLNDAASEDDEGMEDLQP
jgi:protein SPA2